MGKKNDTIIAHCIARAIVAEAGGEEAAQAVYGEKAEAFAASKWFAFKVAARVTPKASRVAAFVSIWGLALYDLGRDEITVDEYAEWSNESRATCFRRAGEYRELWPDVDMNVLGGLVRDQIRENAGLRKHPARLTSVAVTV